MLEDTLNSDLKRALLDGDKQLVATLRGLKSALLYAKIAANTRDQATPDEVIIAVLQKEAKKRQESADLYRQGGSSERAAAELEEKAIIEHYLPQQLNEDEVVKLVNEVIASMDQVDRSAMGAIIAKVKAQASGRADGSTIARIVKAHLEKHS